MDFQSPLLAKARWRPLEFVVWAVAFVLPLVLPQHALMINEIAIVALFAMSLDLILGYTGIVSLGHAGFFGLGAYTAALFAKHVMPDPTVGLVVAIVFAGLVGTIASVTILRGTADTARKQGWNVLDALKTPSPILIARLKAA